MSIWSPMKWVFRYPELHHLVKSLLNSNKHERPSATEVQKSSEIRSVIARGVTKINLWKLNIIFWEVKHWNEEAILLLCPRINTGTSRAVLAHVLVESHGVVSPRGDHRPCWLPGVGVVLQDGVPSTRATWISKVSWMRETLGSFIVIPNMNTLLSTVAARSPYLWDGSWAAPLQLVKSTITSVESNAPLLPVPPVTKITWKVKVQNGSF